MRLIVILGIFLILLFFNSKISAEEFTKDIAINKIVNFKKITEQDASVNYLILVSNTHQMTPLTVLCHKDKDALKDILIVFDSLTGTPLMFFIDGSYYYFNIETGKLTIIESAFFSVKVAAIQEKRWLFGLKTKFDINLEKKCNEISVDLSSLVATDSDSFIEKKDDFDIFSQTEKSNLMVYFKNNNLVGFRETIKNNVYSELFFYIIESDEIILKQATFLRQLVESFKKSDNIQFQKLISEINDPISKKIELIMVYLSYQRFFFNLQSLKEHTRVLYRKSEEITNEKIQKNLLNLINYTVTTNSFMATNKYYIVKDIYELISEIKPKF